LTYCLQVSLDLLLLHIQFPFELMKYLIVDASLITESNDGSPLGWKYLLAQPVFGLLVITIPLVCVFRSVQSPRVVLGFLFIDGT
jgi:hypothetical protein